MKNNNENNTISIVGFILSFIIPIVGLILSIIGLSKSKELDNKGKGLSIAGIIISVLLFIFQFLIFLLIISVGTVSSTLDTAKNNANKLMCEKAYDCELDSTGNYSCKYLNNDGTIKKITCENNTYLTKEELVGYYEPYDLKVNGVSESVENYLGNNNEKSYIIFNDDNTFKNYLTYYSSEDEITGKYTINKNIINITLNTNTNIKIEAEKENNTILLKMYIDESTVLYLKQIKIESEKDLNKIGTLIETGAYNGQQTKVKYYALINNVLYSLYADDSQNTEYINYTKIKVKKMDENVDSLYGIEIGNAGFIYSIILKNGNVFYINNNNELIKIKELNNIQELSINYVDHQMYKDVMIYAYDETGEEIEITEILNKYFER